MTFGNKQMDRAYDDWKTRSPYECSDKCIECGKILTEEDDCGHDCEVSE